MRGDDRHLSPARNRPAFCDVIVPPAAGLLAFDRLGASRDRRADPRTAGARAEQLPRKPRPAFVAGTERDGTLLEPRGHAWAEGGQQRRIVICVIGSPRREHIGGARCEQGARLRNLALVEGQARRRRSPCRRGRDVDSSIVETPVNSRLRGRGRRGGNSVACGRRGDAARGGHHGAAWRRGLRPGVRARCRACGDDGNSCENCENATSYGHRRGR